MTSPPLSASRALLAFMVVTILAGGCGRISGAKDAANNGAGQQLGTQSPYCKHLPEVRQPLRNLARLYGESDTQTGKSSTRLFLLRSRDVVRAANEIAQEAPRQVRPDWMALIKLYRLQARVVAHATQPLDALVDLEEGPVEWTSAVFDAWTNIDDFAFDYCSRRSNLASIS